MFPYTVELTYNNYNLHCYADERADSWKTVKSLLKSTEPVAKEYYTVD